MAEAVKRLTPLFNRVLIKKADPVTQTKSGFHIPEKSRPDYYKGTVLAVGAGGRNRNGEVVPCCLKAGDEVLLPDYGGTPIKVGDDNVQYYIYREPDILAKLNE